MLGSFLEILQEDSYINMQVDVFFTAPRKNVQNKNAFN